MRRMLLGLLVITGLSLPLVPQATAQNGAKAMAKPAVRGRLPAYYGKIVDDAQKARIYKIQAEYSAKLDALKAELDSLTEKRDNEVRAVLTAAQQRKLEELKAAAKKNREAAKDKQIDQAAN